MHRGGLALATATVLVGPLLATAPAAAAPSTTVLTTTARTGSGSPVVIGLPAGGHFAAAGLSGAVGQPAALGWRAEPAPVGAPQPVPPETAVFVEVSPSTVQPGFLVGIRASCRDNSIPATVVSDAFGRVQVQPQRGLLTAAPMVRERTRPGNYRIKLECRDGETASTMLQVVKAVKPSRGPATGFGGGAGGFTGGLLLPGGIALTVTGIVLAVLAARRPRSVRGVARR
ncbi:hypothetical protein ACGF7U_23865 [Micromonospora sp. NPDC047670]|uniref:hypothetical protein n=1 Tax=Micromonospora sp. NPDC047670 TaxID=3364252 RepID=UPI003710F9AD